jgi:hypothetical protein
VFDFCSLLRNTAKLELTNSQLREEIEHGRTLLSTANMRLVPEFPCVGSLQGLPVGVQNAYVLQVCILSLLLWISNL